MYIYNFSRIPDSGMYRVKKCFFGEVANSKRRYVPPNTLYQDYQGGDNLPYKPPISGSVNI